MNDEHTDWAPTRWERRFGGLRIVVCDQTREPRPDRYFWVVFGGPSRVVALRRGDTNHLARALRSAEVAGGEIVKKRKEDERT